MAGFEKFLKDECGIDFHWLVHKETKNLKWRDSTGPEKLQGFSKIKIPELLPRFQSSRDIQKLWDNFGNIYEQLLINDADDDHISQLEKDIKDWMLLFISLYQTKHVTPYMHALLQHVPETMSIHKSLVKFNQQGLEKLNNNQTKEFYSSTNLRGTEAMVMLFQKKNSLEHLEDAGYE